MLQLFLKTSDISAENWAIVYQKISDLVTAFPLKLLRIESYNGYESNQDKDHLNLLVNLGMEDEHLAFYGDFISWTSGTTIRFYKNWEKHRQLALESAHSDPSKPITWYQPTTFKNDGSIPEANGEATIYGYIDTRNALYQYAIIAIGVLLENVLPGRAFLIAQDQDISNIQQVTEWLEGHFQENFDLPIYFDKKRLLDSFVQEYPDKKDAVERMEYLYPNEYKRNMVFALEHLGYEPTFRFYAQVLSDCIFGTFGFSDVLDPWIAATQDLEKALQLISESKRLLLERGDTAAADKYDLNLVLTKLLDQFVLWTPQQREELDHFYTNKEALETGNEGLWGAIFRMAGHRVDICPIVADSNELFEAFMYHDPKNGAVFKKTIDDWCEKNIDSFGLLKTKLASQKNDPEEIEDDEIEDDENDKSEDHIPELEQASILSQFPAHEHFFIQQAIRINPGFFRLEEALADLRQYIWKIINEEGSLDYVQKIREESIEDKKIVILQQLKKKRSVVTIGIGFEHWLFEEMDENVLLCLRLLLSLKIYNRSRAYARYRILHDRELWQYWRKLV
ncbi:MAG: hypothetical protein RIR11_2631 [Bacteroidota bacterium]|jgi:hypothetical protein